MQIIVGMDRFDEWFPEMEWHYKRLVEKHNDDIMAIRKEMPKSSIAIHCLPPQARKMLGTKAGPIFFSADGLAKQLFEHPELAASEYQSVLSKLDQCKEIYQSKDLHVVLILHNRRWYQVVVKTTSDRHEAFLVSLHRLNKDSLAFARKAKRIY